jgi:hypothetical protein
LFLLQKCPLWLQAENVRIKDGPTLPMELPLSRKPVERDGDTYKRLKTAMTRRLRGETN